MAAQKFTRKDLKKDSFVESTDRALSFIQQHATAVGAVLLILVVLLVGGSYVRKGQQAAKMEASFLLYQGQLLLAQGDYDLALARLQACLENHRKTDYAKYARLGIVQALLANGEIDVALARLDEYRRDLRASDPVQVKLDNLYAHALADAGRFAEAVTALAALPDADLPPAFLMERRLQQARWLEAAGDHRGAVALLEELHQAVVSGKLEAQRPDLELRLEVARALLY